MAVESREIASLSHEEKALELADIVRVVDDWGADGLKDTMTRDDLMSDLQTSRVMWLLFGVPFPVIAVLGAIEAIALERARGLLYPAVVLGLFSIVHLSWLKTARLSLGDAAVRYRALFVRKDIQLSEIARAKFEFGPKGMGPMQRIVFELRGRKKHEIVTINAGLFDVKQSKQWVEALNCRVAK